MFIHGLLGLVEDENKRSGALEGLRRRNGYADGERLLKHLEVFTVYHWGKEIHRFLGT